MNHTSINEMFESEEAGEMRFNRSIRLAEDDFDDVFDFIEKFGGEIMLDPDISCLEEQRNNTNKVDDILFSDDFEFDNLIEELNEEIRTTQEKTCPKEQRKCTNDVDSYDGYNKLSYDGYNKLVYQGQEYYVKKKNIAFPICVMNSNLVQVGIIVEEDVNNIILL